MPVGSAVIESNGHFIVDKKSGLAVPRVSGSETWSYYNTYLTETRGNVMGGVPLTRDDATGVWQIPGYGTGYDDFLMRTIVRGNVSNIGISPIIDSGLSALVAKMQAMASTWEVLLTGKVTPVTKGAEIISRANDSDVGISDFISKYIGALLTENRGAFVSFAPIRTVAFDNWEEYGMNAVPIDKGTKKGKQRYYYLDMSTQSFRENQGVWTLDGLLCWPTGNPEWPFWYKVPRGGSDAWVLIHRDFGTQVLYHIGGEDTIWAGMGQSPSWRYLNILTQEIMRVENDIEAMLNRPPDGIVHGSGLDTPDQLSSAVKAHNRDREEGRVLYYPGTMFMGSVSENAKIALLEFTRPPAGYDFNSWKTWREDMLALCFGVSATWVVTRIGTGSLTQSGVTNEITAQTGLAHLETMIQSVLARCVPPRVSVLVHYRSDRQTRFQVETVDLLAGAIQKLQAAGDGQTLTVPEIRTIIEQHGLNIPGATEDTQTGTVGDARVVTDSEGSPDEPSSQRRDEQEESRGMNRVTVADLFRIKASVPIGAEVRIGTATGKITAWSVEYMQVWVEHPWHRFTGGGASVYAADRVEVLSLTDQ